MFELIKHRFVDHNKMTYNLCDLIDNIECSSSMPSSKAYPKSQATKDIVAPSPHLHEESKEKICLNFKKNQQYRAKKANQLKRKLNYRDTVLPNDPSKMLNPGHLPPTKTQTAENQAIDTSTGCKNSSETTMTHSSTTGPANDDNYF